MSPLPVVLSRRCHPFLSLRSSSACLPRIHFSPERTTHSSDRLPPIPPFPIPDAICTGDAELRCRHYLPCLALQLASCPSSTTNVSPPHLAASSLMLRQRASLAFFQVRIRCRFLFVRALVLNHFPDFSSASPPRRIWPSLVIRNGRQLLGDSFLACRNASKYKHSVVAKLMCARPQFGRKQQLGLFFCIRIAPNQPGAAGN
ncbi:hypothetical protein CSPAE12_04145 [Colletotrichum incanum]|nr:hypothetical protein CSPAE12_04145 [Colletotrichum incanum]